MSWNVIDRTSTSCTSSPNDCFSVIAVKKITVTTASLTR